ncbi:hypothetical protein [Rahnella inusitata]|uniref:hypothetical protein n=1 Tax=Rahnella inusitata TaxID=58169 RepID=UPI0039AEDAB9
MTTPTIFSLKVLQAINDWQICANTKRGNKLKSLAANLPLRYRTCQHECYRKINMNKGATFDLMGKFSLKEKISSWSTDIDIVKKFKRGVTKDVLHEQSIIFKLIPSCTQVIINLDEVYRCVVDFNLNCHCIKMI